MSIRTVQSIMTKEQRYKSVKKRKVRGVTKATTKERLDRAILILSLHADQELVVSDEDILVVQQ